jgi:hypothetical protein
MTTLNKIGLAILLLVVVSGIWLVVKGGGAAIFGSGTPGQADLERSVLLDTNSNIQAKIKNLSQLREAYEESTDADLKATLRTMILNEAQDVDDSKLPADLKRFIADLQKEDKKQ